MEHVELLVGLLSLHSQQQISVLMDPLHPYRATVHELGFVLVRMMELILLVVQTFNVLMVKCEVEASLLVSTLQHQLLPFLIQFQAQLGQVEMLQ